MNVESVQRVFRVGRSEVPDPAPGLGYMEAWNLIKGNYPHLQNAVVNEPTVEGGRMMVIVEQPPAKTNG